MYIEKGALYLMKSYSSREVIKMLEDDGWYEIKIVGSHHHFRHSEKNGKVTVPHPKRDLPIKTVKSILNQAGLSI